MRAERNAQSSGASDPYAGGQEGRFYANGKRYASGDDQGAAQPAHADEDGARLHALGIAP